jgi:hypothetical protein
VVTVLHVGVVIFIIIAGLTQSKASNFIAGGCGASEQCAPNFQNPPLQPPCLQPAWLQVHEQGCRARLQTCGSY